MVLAGIAVVGAPAAAAATADPSTLYVPNNGGACGGPGPNDGFWSGPGGTGTKYASQDFLTAAVGDTVTIVNECTTQDIDIFPGATPAVTITILRNQQAVVTIEGTQNLIAYQTGTTNQVAATNISGTSPSPPQPSGSTDTSGAPAPVIQQFGLPSSGNCEDGASDALNLAGVSSGGWGISWAQWMNDQRGGAVCSRTLMYDTNLAKWIVN